MVAVRESSTIRQGGEVFLAAFWKLLGEALWFLEVSNLIKYNN